MKRATIKQAKVEKTEREKKEDKRQNIVSRQKKQIERLSSNMNACQAVVKPDCSKPKVAKSAGIQKALASLLTKYLVSSETTASGNTEPPSLHEYMALRLKVISHQVAKSIKVCTNEFAGVKFKTRVVSGTEYIAFIQDKILLKSLREMPNLKYIAVCEEMYSFTPDDFKAATREQRQRKKGYSISHLKTSDELLSSDTFDKKSIITTLEGKCLISTYLAKHVKKLDIRKDVQIDIQSELLIGGCTCTDSTVACNCNKYTTPLRCTFTRADGLTDVKPVQTIIQRKGEAEMSQVDWLIEYKDTLSEEDACMSVVSSGDIDAITIHMFALAHLWPKKDDGTYKKPSLCAPTEGRWFERSL